MESSIQMEEALIKVGLPVKCAKCKKEGRVRPKDYGGWYKSRLFRLRPKKRWFCPEHHDIGKRMDEHFYDISQTPQPDTTVEDSTEELYKLLD